MAQCVFVKEWDTCAAPFPYWFIARVANVDARAFTLKSCPYEFLCHFLPPRK